MLRFLKDLFKTIITTLLIIPAWIVGAGIGKHLWGKIESKLKKDN
jgi:hypothetical protein